MYLCLYECKHGCDASVYVHSCTYIQTYTHTHTHAQHVRTHAGRFGEERVAEKQSQNVAGWMHISIHMSTNIKVQGERDALISAAYLCICLCAFICIRIHAPQQERRDAWSGADLEGELKAACDLGAPLWSKVRAHVCGCVCVHFCSHACMLYLRTYALYVCTNRWTGARRRVMGRWIDGGGQRGSHQRP